MTYPEQIDAINKMLPAGQLFSRWYRAFEGDVRVISKDASGREYRYRAEVGNDGEILDLTAF